MRTLCIVLFMTLMSCDRPNRQIKNTERPNNSQVSNPRERTIPGNKTRNIDGNKLSNRIRMKPMGGVYEIPIKINGVAMNFIFDTGASNISISDTEVLFLLKQGKITELDILGTVRFSDATGRISEGTMINLREVQIGNRMLKNVKANVVHSINSPLLLGQSALGKFGKVTIDYENNILSFE